MYDRIVAPLDGSPLAEQVLPYVTRISLGLGIPIHLMQAFHTVSEEMADPVHGLYNSNMTAGVHDEVLDYLNGVKRNTPGMEITCEAYEGDAVTHIVEEANKTPNALIAMSTHGRSGITRWLLGSVTDKVLHSAKNPMLIVRGRHAGDPEPDEELKTIIVPVDGSSLAEQVLPHVAALANGLNLKVILLRAAATPEEFSTQTGYQRLDGVAGIHFQHFEAMAQEAGNQALDYLESLKDKLSREGVASVEHQIVRGPAARVIVDLAQATPDNMLAMTTHGRSGPARWAMGSVADRVVRNSGDPVLVIRAG
ncbi:MAG: universal stress protein [Chloroflexi bacterium]|nr:universal stress protein [Chloroflexota bacterium]MDA1272217.1 universal stress protein [Chloroflexota bacterium]PKB58654.1 MAG: hypothetical protein BZY83_05840 [SAR202 cluster bacterium Casp-Chloro-G2]